jgi:hypothetical protein
MPKRKPIDPRSPEPRLRYSGRPLPADIPTRDLHGGDLARIHHVRAMATAAGEFRPEPATAEELLALALELVALGLFVLIEEGEEPTVTKLEIASSVSDIEPAITDYTPADLDGHDDPDEDASPVNDVPPPEEPAPPAEVA